jgi:hypothetical protein
MMPAQLPTNRIYVKREEDPNPLQTDVEFRMEKARLRATLLEKLELASLNKKMTKGNPTRKR